MIIPTGCLIHVVNKPVSARYGIPTMFDMLISDELQIGWNGIEPVVIVTFNAMSGEPFARYLLLMGLVILALQENVQAVGFSTSLTLN